MISRRLNPKIAIPLTQRLLLLVAVIGWLALGKGLVMTAFETYKVNGLLQWGSCKSDNSWMKIMNIRVWRIESIRS
jgi:hypothetical protein